MIKKEEHAQIIQRQQERQGGGAAAHLLEQHVMAAKESGEFLHGAVALGAFQGLGDPTSSHWELKAGARMNNVMKIFMVFLEGQIKTLNWHLLLP